MGAVGFTSGDPRKVDVAGDTMTGDLVLPADPDQPLEAATKQYVDAAGGGGGTPSNTVVSETVYGQAATAGAAAAFSRGDHTHGSPSLTNSAPATTHSIGQAAAVGVATSPARADHVHPIAASGTPSTSAVGDSAAQGATTTFARSDHAHGREGFAAPAASAVGDTQSAGSASTVARSDHRHAREGFGAVTTETSFGQASSDGVATTVARSDHTHGTPSAPSVPSAASTVVAETSYGASTAVGVATTYAREDHTHGSPSLTSSTPAAETIGAAGAVGVATTPARADHVHGFPAAAVPGNSAVGDSAAAGSAGTLARSDHVHGRESFGPVTAQTTYGAASGDGTAATLARSDHTHGTPTLGTTGTTAAAGNDTRIVNAVQQTLLDAKGDLIVASAADSPARQSVGTDGQVLRADSGQTTGVAWDTLNAADVGAADAAHTHPAGDIVSDTLAVARGGTGIGSYTTNNYLRASGATSLEQRTPSQVLADIAAVGHALADAKGDLLAASGADAFVRLPVGTNGQVLTADSAETAGVKWATPSGGSGGGYRGTWSSVTAYVAGDIVTHRRASYGAVASSTNVDPAALVELFPGHTPANLALSDASAYELAVTFTVSATRRMTRALYYKSDLQDSGPAHILSLWDSVFGLVASGAVVGETASGIQAAPLVADLMPGRTYYLSYGKLSLGNGDAGYAITTSFGWPSTVDVLTATEGRFSTAIGTMPNNSSTANYAVWPEWEDIDGTKWDLLGRMDPLAWGDSRSVVATVRGQS